MPITPYHAKFNRIQDAHAPQGQTMRLVLDGRLQQDDNGPLVAA